MLCTVLGSSGFIARYIIERLAADRRHTIHALTRNSQNTRHLRVLGDPGQIRVIEYGNNPPHSFIKNSDVIINLIGSINASKKNFFATHSQIPEEIAQECAKQSVGKFIHFSSLGIENNTSIYARSKINGEKAVLAFYPNATIIKPGLIIGTNNRLLRLLYKLSHFAFYPVIGNGTILQPVSAGDVAKFVEKIALGDVGNNVATGPQEIVGPTQYSFKEFMAALSKTHNTKKCTPITVPYGLAKILTYFLQLLPMRITTRPLSGDYQAALSIDQLQLMHNNKFTTNNNALQKVDIQPEDIEQALIRYL